MEENISQLSEKYNKSKTKKNNYKNKKVNNLESSNEDKKIFDKINNDFFPLDNNNNIISSIKKHKKGIKSSTSYEEYELPDNINNIFLKEKIIKDDKNKKKKINSKKNNKSENSENKNLNNIKISKLKNLINKLNNLFLINITNKYYQRWMLQTFDIIEEDSEEPDEKEVKDGKEVKEEKDKDKYNKKEKEKEENEEEEEEEEEENDYGGDLEEIEERAPDEEESVITSVQSKVKIKRTNDILFALRKIIKYKNIFFRYFIRWYNAVDINGPTNEYKKIRKEKKINNNINNINININAKKNLASNFNNINIIEFKNPIYEVSSEEKIDESKSDAKINLKNFIELKGTKKNILKKYYEIWYNLTLNKDNNNNSLDSNNNEQNEYIFTYHGNARNKSNNSDKKIKIDKSNITEDNMSDKNKEIKEYNNKRPKINSDNLENITPKKTKEKKQCYIKKKIYSIKKEDINNENKKSKKKNKNNIMLKNIIIKANNKNLLFSTFKKWIQLTLNKNQISKVIFKKKQSTKIKKKITNSKNKKKIQTIKINTEDNDELQKKDKNKFKKNISDNSNNINSFSEEQFSDSMPINNIKKYSTVNNIQINSDNSINNSISINTNSNSANEILEQLKEKESGNVDKKSKKVKKDGNKKIIKSKDKKESNIQIKNKEEGEDNENIRKMIEKICRIHQNQRAQRYLLIKPPIIKKSKKEKKLEDRQSFSSINYSLKIEKFQKKLMKLFLKATCRQDPLMKNFDIWFNKTFKSGNYIPFIRKKSSTSSDGKIKVKRNISKVKKIKKNKKINNEEEINNKKRDISADNVNTNL